MARHMLHPDPVISGGGHDHSKGVAGLNNFGDDNKNKVIFKTQEERALAANSNNIWLASQAAYGK